MKISDIGRLDGLVCLQDQYDDDVLQDAYTSDLLSDVMANASDNSALITIQAHKNTVAVASLVGLGAIIVCNNRTAPDDMLEAARSEGIAIFKTEDNQFRTSVKIGQQLGI